MTYLLYRDKKRVDKRYESLKKINDEGKTTSIVGRCLFLNYNAHRTRDWTGFI